jgi:hypothetical protein
MAKIYGIDWSYTEENDLVTCSEDKQVKVCISIIHYVLTSQVLEHHYAQSVQRHAATR